MTAMDVVNGDLMSTMSRIFFFELSLAHILNVFFPQGIHLKGCQRCNIPLGHARQRQQRQPGGALQVDISFIKTEYGTCFLHIFSQRIHGHCQVLQVNKLFLKRSVLYVLSFIFSRAVNLTGSRILKRPLFFFLLTVLGHCF